MRFKHLKSCFVSSVYQKSAAAIRRSLTAVGKNKRPRVQGSGFRNLPNW